MFWPALKQKISQPNNKQSDATIPLAVSIKKKKRQKERDREKRKRKKKRTKAASLLSNEISF